MSLLLLLLLLWNWLPRQHFGFKFIVDRLHVLHDHIHYFFILAVNNIIMFSLSCVALGIDKPICVIYINYPIKTSNTFTLYCTRCRIIFQLLLTVICSVNIDGLCVILNNFVKHFICIMCVHAVFLILHTMINTTINTLHAFIIFNILTGLVD